MIEQDAMRTDRQPEQPQVEPARMEQAIDIMRSEQNLLMALVGGAGAALIGAVLWAVVTVATGYQIGFMAIGVGFLVGISSRKLGMGIDRSFGFAGAFFALAGCLLGNLLAVCGMVANQEGIPILQVLSAMSPQDSIELMVATFTPMDLLFYGIAVYEGYRFSFRQVTGEDLARILPEVRGTSTSA